MNILWTAPRDFLPEGFFARYEWATVAHDLRFNNYDAWVVNPLKPVRATDLLKLPLLKVIATPSTGTNHLPLADMEHLHIDCLSLTHDRESLAEIRASSEFTFLLILACLKNLRFGIWQTMAKRPWHSDEHTLRGNELYGKKVGIVGLGRIGSNVRRWCSAFGANVVYCDPQFDGISLEELFLQSEVIVICVPLNDETYGLINENLLNCMGQGTVLVNTSRGEIIDENALVGLLRRRPDLRVGVDVLAGEALGRQPHSPLVEMRNVIVTPHMAGTTIESQTKAAKITMRLLREYNG